MSDVDVLASVLDKEAALVAAVPRERLGDPTPCPDYDVRALLDHVVGWLRAFAAGVHGRDPDGDPSAYTTDDHAGEFRAAADELVRGWRDGGVDRPVRFASREMPGEAVLGMQLMEYVTHGCDVAIATGQEVPFSDDELETTLARAQVNLPDERRGTMFGPRIDVPDDAPALDRLLGYMGRSRA